MGSSLPSRWSSRWLFRHLAALDNFRGGGGDKGGLQASAIRYYERVGLLPRAPRISGQRRYDTTTFYPLAIIQRARQLGFTLTEIRHLFFAFRDITRPSERWRTLSQKKLAELDDLMDGIKAVRGVLKKMMTKCRCDTLDECGEGVFRSMDGSRSR